MNAAARYPNISRRMLAIAAKKARDAGIDVDDAHQELSLIAIENECNYDAGRGVARENYYIECLKIWILRQRSQTRHGVCLDDQESDVAEATIAGAAAGGEIAPSRFASDVDVDERIAILPDHLRVFGQRFVAGMSCKEAADDLGMTDRRARQVVEEIVEFFASNSSFQPSRF